MIGVNARAIRIIEMTAVFYAINIDARVLTARVENLYIIPCPNRS